MESNCKLFKNLLILSLVIIVVLVYFLLQNVTKKAETPLVGEDVVEESVESDFELGLSVPIPKEQLSKENDSFVGKVISFSNNSLTVETESGERQVTVDEGTVYTQEQCRKATEDDTESLGMIGLESICTYADINQQSLNENITVFVNLRSKSIANSIEIVAENPMVLEEEM